MGYWVMNDLFDALRESINKYVNVDSLNPREQQRIRSIYDKYVYNYDTIDALFDLNTEETDDDSK